MAVARTLWGNYGGFSEETAAPTSLAQSAALDDGQECATVQDWPGQLAIRTFRERPGVLLGANLVTVAPVAEGREDVHRTCHHRLIPTDSKTL